MWRKLSLAGVASLLAACTTPPPPGTPTPASAVGTPFYIAFKIPVCAATVVLGGPWAGVTGLVDDEQAREMRDDINRGLVQNCGPPYVLPND